MRRHRRQPWPRSFISRSFRASAAALPRPCACARRPRGAEPSTGARRPRASIRRMVNWLGQNLSMPSFAGAHRRGEQLRSDRPCRRTRLSGTSTLPDSAKRRLANSVAPPSAVHIQRQHALARARSTCPSDRTPRRARKRQSVPAPFFPFRRSRGQAVLFSFAKLLSDSFCKKNYITCRVKAQ